MKKLALSMIAAAGMFFYTGSIQAQEDPEVEVETEVEATAQTQQEFEKIDVAALPQAVKDAVMTDFTEATTEEAWVKEEDGQATYKIKLNINGETKKVYADQEGNWIEKEQDEQ